MHTHPAEELVVSGLDKSFGEVKILHDLSFRIGPGEFVGLMGPNGAGKSTLIKCLDGVHQATSGTISLGGTVVPTLGGRTDVGFIHQDLGLVDTLTVLDNLRLGETPLRRVGPFLDRRAERAAAETALERVGLAWAVDTPVGALAPGERALVAIARAFARGARILFVDEATSTLPGPDARRVIDALRENAARGAIVVMVTHKLHEILDATQRVLVILDGRLAVDQPTAGLDRAGLVELLLQHETEHAGQAPQTGGEPGEVLLELRGACAGRVGPVDLTLRAGDAVGLTGLPGSGLHDIGFLAAGAVRPRRGTVSREPGTRIALIPPHRESQGGFAELDVLENMTISSLRRWRTPGRLLARGREARDAQRTVERLSVKPRSAAATFGTLSGGNKQKVIFGRAVLQEPQVYVLCEPTRGVDVGTRSEIYDLIDELRAGGAAVLVISSDAEDLFATCATVAVVEDGRLTEARPLSSINPETLEAMV